MEIHSYIIIALLSLVTETVAAMAGFGDKLALIAILTLFIDFKTAVVVAAVYSLVSYTIRILFFHKHFNKKLFIKMLIFLIPGIIIGLFVFGSLHPEKLQLVFSIFLLGFVVYRLFVGNSKGFKIGEVGLGIGVFLFGLVEASIGAAGPLLAIFLLHYGKRKERFVVFAAALLLVSSIVRLPGYAYLGLINPSSVPLIVLLVAVSITGNYIGRKLLKKIPPTIFEYLILLILFGIAANGIISKVLNS